MIDLCAPYDAPYSLREDIATSTDFWEATTASTDDKDLPTTRLEAHSPGVSGCQRHRKALMLTVDRDGDFFDIFLEGAAAKQFIDQVAKVRRNLSLKPLVVSFDLALEKKKLSFLVVKGCLTSFFQRIDAFQPEIDAYLINPENAIPTTPPMRQAPPPPPRVLTPEEAEAEREAFRILHRMDPRDIDLEGINKGLLLAALYNNALTGGMGIQSYRKEQMIPAEGQHLFSELKRIGAPAHIDYINGRSIKCHFDEKDGRTVLSFSRFWDYNYIPVTEIIDLARKGIYSSLPKQGVLDCENEAVILKKRGENSITKWHPDIVQELLKQQQDEYIKFMQSDEPTGVYQISVVDYRPGEIGSLVKPFSMRSQLRAIKGGTPRTPTR